MYLHDLPPAAMQRVLLDLCVRDRLTLSALSTAMHALVQQNAPIVGPVCEMTPVCAEPSLRDIQTVGQCLKFSWVLLRRLAVAIQAAEPAEDDSQTFRLATECAMEAAKEYRLQPKFEYQSEGFHQSYCNLEVACAEAAAAGLVDFFSIRIILPLDSENNRFEVNILPDQKFHVLLQTLDAAVYFYGTPMYAESYGRDLGHMGLVTLYPDTVFADSKSLRVAGEMNLLAEGVSEYVFGMPLSLWPLGCMPPARRAAYRRTITAAGVKLANFE